MREIRIRPLEGMAEYEACIALQRTTWGEGFTELVPASLLMVAQEMGGVASGAFDGDRLVGFVFGISGLRDGEPAHWSDMLAVDPEYRGRGVGRSLKLHQRELLLDRGIGRMLWTFDPLVARNAHLNLRRLGATSREYLRDAYGESASPLHAGIGTDRLLVQWDLASDRVKRHVAGAVPEEDPGAPLVATPLGMADGSRPGPFEPRAGARAVRVAIPADIEALKGRDPVLARAWRASVREALEWAFGEGYVATDVGALDDHTAAYTLVRDF